MSNSVLAVQNKPREQLSSSLEPMGIAGLVAEVDWPAGVLPRNDDLLRRINIQSLDDLILEEKGNYLVINGQYNFLEQVCRDIPQQGPPLSPIPSPFPCPCPLPYRLSERGTHLLLLLLL